MFTGLISLLTKNPKQELADEFIKFIETGDTKLLQNYQIQIGNNFSKGDKGYINLILKNKATKEKEYFSVGVTPFLCNQESGNYGQEFACIRMKQNGKHTNIKTYEVLSTMYSRIQQLISNVTSSRNSRFQNVEDFAETYLSLNGKYVYPLKPAPLMQITSNGAFKIGNGTATWVNRPTNTTGEVRSVFNGTNAVEPTAIPNTPKEQDTGTPTTAIAGLVALGVVIGVGAGLGYSLWKRMKSGSYDVTDLESNLGEKDGARLKSRNNLPGTGPEVKPFLPQVNPIQKPPRLGQIEPKALANASEGLDEALSGLTKLSSTLSNSKQSGAPLMREDRQMSNGLESLNDPNLYKTPGLQPQAGSSNSLKSFEENEASYNKSGSSELNLSTSSTLSELSSSQTFTRSDFERQSVRH